MFEKEAQAPALPPEATIEVHAVPICVLLRSARLATGGSVPISLLITPVTGPAELMIAQDEAPLGPFTVYDAEATLTDAFVMLAVL